MTRESTILRTDLRYNAGKSPKLAIANGPIGRGFIQGVGFATTEEVVYDHKRLADLLMNSAQTRNNRMEPPAQPMPSPQLDIRRARGSSVIVQRVPADRVELFLEWQRGITSAARGFTGYQTTEVYSPAPGQKEWVVVIHFDNGKTLQDWLDSPTRAEWIAKLTDESRDYRMQVLPSGFGPWIAGLDSPNFPHWKMCLTVLLGLYPTVMVLNMLLTPQTARFGLAVSILIGNAVSVVFLEFMGMPVVNRLLGPWLRANEKHHRRHSLVGLVVIVAALGIMTGLFSLITH